MGRTRLLLIYSLGALILGGSLYDVIRGTEHWPFYHYRLVAQAIESRSLEAFVLFGVTGEKPSREIPLTQFQYTQPFDNSRLRVALGYIYAARRDQLSAAVRDCLMRYEALRRTGHHHGPALQAIRLYRAYWVLDPWGRNVDYPDRKVLLMEIRHSETTGR